MVAVIFMVAMLVLTHGQLEGTIRTPAVQGSWFFFKLTRLRVGVYSYRPGRVYYRLAGA